MSNFLCDLPLAGRGLTSYRCRHSMGGWIMIGARDHLGAMREAKRSCDTASRATLEIWTGTHYAPVVWED